MKNSLLLLAFCLSCGFQQLTAQQNVGIGTTAPNASAALDIVATNKGLLIPRMTLAQRQAMSNFSLGLLIYQTDNTPGFYYVSSLPLPSMPSWTRIDAGIGSAPPQNWAANGNDIYNSNPVQGGVGIGNPAPNASAILDVASTTKGVLIPRMTQAERDAITTPATGLLLFQTDGTAGFYYWDGAAFVQIGAGGGGGQWTTSGNDISNSNPGNVGIGTATPTYKLDVNGAMKADGLHLSNGSFVGTTYNSNLRLSSQSGPTNGEGKHIHLNPVQTTPQSYGNVGIGLSDNALNNEQPTEARLVVKGSVGNTVAMFGKGTAGISLVRDWASVGFNAYYDANWKSMKTGKGAVVGCDPTSGRFEINLNSQTAANQNIATIITPFAIESNGRVVIGAGASANGYILNVRGKAICEEMRVLLTANWPDYVFKPEYKLRPLADVEKHIAENGHLPGIQPAAEIEQNGLDLGAMQTKAMEKIEELTLYLIQLKKENDDLRTRVEALENRK